MTRKSIAVPFVVFVAFALAFAPSVAQAVVAPSQGAQEVAAPAQAVEIEELQMSVDLQVLVSTGLANLGVREDVDICTPGAVCDSAQGCYISGFPSGFACWDCSASTSICCYTNTCNPWDTCC